MSKKQIDCDCCRNAHGKIVPAKYWYGTKDSESLCEKCYKLELKYYQNFKVIGGKKKK